MFKVEAKAMMRVEKLNPFRHVAAPALAAAALGVVCVAGGRYVWPLGLVPGAIFCVIGTRIAYGNRGAANYLRRREVVPLWGVGTSLGVHRQIEGGLVFLVGIFFVILAITGIAQLV
jgi:hypothetical protein